MQPFTAILVLMLAAAAATAAGPDFAADVAGFLDRHCVDCHAGPDAEMGLALDGFADEAAVLAARPRWRKILSRMDSGEMPPPEATRPPAAEVDAFLAAVRGTFARADAAPPDPGPAPIRRLSRAEYDNTIRDLFGTDLRAAANFPPDGVGYGFANIADVLTVSPLLMDRYLDAAEQVAALVLPAEPAKPVRRQVPGHEAGPPHERVPRERFRTLRGSEREPFLSGPLHINMVADPEGEYVVRARLYATAADDGPVRVVLMAAGRGSRSRVMAWLLWRTPPGPRRGGGGRVRS